LVATQQIGLTASFRRGWLATVLDNQQTQPDPGKRQWGQQ
jgi:hypothetical protein